MEAKNLPPEEREARFAEFREQVKHLNDDQKWELSAPMRGKQKAEMDRYFAMSPKEKTKYLDEKIDRSEKMRKEREQKAAQRNASPGSGGPPGTGPVAFKGGGGGGPGANKVGTLPATLPGDPKDNHHQRKKSRNARRSFSNGRRRKSGPKRTSFARK